MLRPALVVAVLALSAGTTHASSSRAMGLYPTAPAGTQPAPQSLPMLDSRIEVTVRGPIVETVVTQRFVNRGDRATEATYIFPLPYDAAVSAMSIRQGTRTIHAAIEARDVAQQRYEAAVRAGVAAAVLDQERPDVFTQTVAAVPPQGTVEITLRYDTLARYADGTWSLVLPMVVAPRYVPGTASGRPTTGSGRAADTDRAPDASRVTPPSSPGGGGSTTIAIEFPDGVREVTSPTHELTIAGTHATFTDLRSDHDAVIRWKTASPAAGWVEQDTGGGYAAVIVAAPAAPARTKPVRLTLVLDRAATMQGDAAVTGAPVVRALLGAMTGGDRVAVIGSAQVAWSMPADALRAIASPSDAGPFDLTRVLRGARPDGAPLVLVTDGLVADDRAALAAAKQLRVPVHVIGVGAAPARGLLVQLAAVTGGTVRFALPADDLGALARAALADAASPPAPLAVTWGALTASDVVPAVLPRLGAGQAMLVLARVKQAQAANGRARGELFAIEPLAASRAVDGAVSAMGPLARRWARTKLDDLLVAGDTRAVTKHALTYGLVSPYTSFVAVGSDVVVQGGVTRSVAVPVAVPAGMQWDVVREQTTPATGETLSVEQTTSSPVVITAPPADKKTGANQDAKQQRDTVKRPPTSKTETTKDERDDARPVAVKPRTQAAPVAPTASGASADVEEAPVVNALPEKTAQAPSDAGGDNAPPAESASTRSVAALDSESAEDEDGVRDAVIVGAHARGYRLSLALGGGLSLDAERTAPVAALAGRFDLGRRANLVGVEANLWLVDGLHGQGRFLVDYTRRGLGRWLELSLGAGLLVDGDGAGAAGALSLRSHLPAQPALSGYLRYDATWRDDAHHALTLGVEWGF